MKIKLLVVTLIFCCSAPIVQAQEVTSYHSSIPSNVIPEGLGVNIHFTDPRQGEMKMLAEAGFRWVRMDFSWSGIEKEKGTYDFSLYDNLVDSLNKYHLKALFILDYGNPLYDHGLSPHSSKAVHAFAQWAAASVRHFAGQGFLWEMWNEPNIGFWKPKPDVNAYIRLALATAKAIQKVTPEEALIGPATSGFPLDFLEACFKAGLLKYWSAVSVHPYRQEGPETVSKDYKYLRQLISKYASPGKTIPVISGEWGYSAAWKGFDSEKQGRMLAREFLTNLSFKIPLSIWYDWHNDGDNPKEAEHNFGTVAYAYHPNENPVYDPKPAYFAIKTLTDALRGFHFDQRINTENPSDHVLLFQKKKEIRIAAWTTQEPHTIVVRVKHKRYHLLNYKGDATRLVKADKRQLKIKLLKEPQYLIRKK